MAAKVHVTIPAQSQPQIPDTAVVQSDSGSAVWRVNEDGEITLVPVVLKNGKITSGLDNGDVIVVTGVGALEAGDRVRAWVKERGL
ncbi:hypothetical protein [Salinivibrio costicola]|uniref:hypothetical protein n=1 Tax=Salinivibrio costicola TaxID=51367 RepID=UPI000471E009|nr:hypothetical protein [Salinivibrio costicola]